MNINFKLWFRKLGAWFQQRFKGTDNKPQDIRIRLEKYMYLEVAHIQGQGSRDYQQDTFGFLPASHKKRKHIKATELYWQMVWGVWHMAMKLVSWLYKKF